MHLPQVLPEGARIWSGLAFLHFMEHHGTSVEHLVSICLPSLCHFVSSTFCIQLFPRDRNVVQTPTVSRAELLPQPAPREMPTEQRASVAETCVAHTAIPGTWDIWGDILVNCNFYCNTYALHLVSTAWTVEDRDAIWSWRTPVLHIAFLPYTAYFTLYTFPNFNLQFARQ